MAVRRSLDMRYGEQIFEIGVSLDGLDLDAPDLVAQIVERFQRRHEALYTYSAPDQDVVLVNARVAVVGALPVAPAEPETPRPGTPRPRPGVAASTSAAGSRCRSTAGRRSRAGFEVGGAGDLRGAHDDGAGARRAIGCGSRRTDGSTWTRRDRGGSARVTRTADVVIIGAGVMGASVAYHLAERGCRDVLVLERGDRAGLGSTGKAMGGFRGQFATEVCVRLSLLAREKLLRFRDELGVDPGYRPVGYLFMARTAAQLETLRTAQTVQRRAGLHETREVGPDEIRRLSPAVRAERYLGGVFCPTDGYIAPLEILRGYLAGAQRLGVDDRVRGG